jgi:hypothetical protein
MYKRLYYRLAILSSLLISAQAMFAQAPPMVTTVTAPAQQQQDAKPAPAPLAAPACGLPAAGCCQAAPSCCEIKKCCPHKVPRTVEYKEYCCECEDFCVPMPTVFDLLRCAAHPHEGDHTPIPGSVMFPQKREHCLCNQDPSCCEGCLNCKLKTKKVLVKFKVKEEQCVTKCEVEHEIVPCCAPTCSSCASGTCGQAVPPASTGSIQPLPNPGK